MAGVKQQVIQMIQALPEEVSVDDIMAELFFKLQVDAGLRELDEGKGIPHDEVEKRMVKNTKSKAAATTRIRPIFKEKGLNAPL